MPKDTEFCLPTAGKAVPSGEDWIHEVKYDGYRVRVVRNGTPMILCPGNLLPGNC
jgi:ATP-dependent DNA ligase